MQGLQPGLQVALLLEHGLEADRLEGDVKAGGVVRACTDTAAPRPKPCSK